MRLLSARHRHSHSHTEVLEYSPSDWPAFSKVKDLARIEKVAKLAEKPNALVGSALGVDEDADGMRFWKGADDKMVVDFDAGLARRWWLAAVFAAAFVEAKVLLGGLDGNGA